MQTALLIAHWSFLEVPDINVKCLLIALDYVKDARSVTSRHSACWCARDPFVLADCLPGRSRCLCTSYPFLGGLGEGNALRSSCSHPFVRTHARAPSPTHLYAKPVGMLT
jgi:hypothetical protein